MYKGTETIQDVIDLLIAAVPGAPCENTVDTVKSGDPRQNVRGVATTFMANTHVIQEAIKTGANLIVTHEPTYYSHEDATDWLADDPVYRHKRGLLETSDVVVWRLHDYMHSMQPDGVVVAAVERLGWQEYAEQGGPGYRIPPTTVVALGREVKQRLGSSTIRLVGDPDMECRRVALLVGASGGRSHISFMSNSQVDVLIVGEIAEWETSEYVRDAITSGQHKALIVAGHASTEDWGMEWLARWLAPKLPGIPVRHIPSGSPFAYL